MKKWMVACVTLFLLMIASTAMAMTQTEWSQQCLYKISGSATVYELYVHETTATDLTDSERYEFLPVYALSNAYVTLLDAEVNGKSAVFYLDGSGNVQEGYVSSSAISYAGVKLMVGSQSVSVPETIANNPEAIFDYLRVTYGFEANLEDIRNAIAQSGDTSADTANGGSGTAATASATEKVNFYLVDEEGDAQAVTMEMLGTVYSTVKVDGESTLVRTADLQWDSEAEEGQALALITAPRTGEASLRSKASTKGTVLLKCKTNRVVLVLKVGQNFSRVLYDDTVGYVLTSALTFCPVGYVHQDGEDDADALQEPVRGWVSFRGNLNSNNTINVRMSASSSSRILDDFKAGTPITIFDIGEKWAEIEVEGYHGYILSEYVTVDESAEDEDKAAAEAEDDTGDEADFYADSDVESEE